MRTIYGDYRAPAVSRVGIGPWHIESETPGTALCGKVLTGDLSRMTLHVRLLECSTCMRLGKDVYQPLS